MSELATNLLDGIAQHGSAADPEWVTELRELGRVQFEKFGLPGKRIEEWKYTSLLPLERLNPGLGNGPESATAAFVPQALVDSEQQVSMVDGRFSELQGKLPAGVSVRSLGTVLSDEPAVLKSLLQSMGFNQARHGFSALNTADLNAGVVIQVEANTNAGELLLQWNSSDAGASALQNTRVILILEPGASLHLLEQLENRSEDSSILNQVIQCQLAESAHLIHTRLQQQSSRSVFISRTEASQADGSRYQFTALDMGEGLVRHDVKSSLNGTGASCEMNGAVIAGGQSHSDHHLEASHVAVNCESSQLFRAVAMDRARVVFNGKVHVHKGADGTEAKQSSKGLLLSKLAEIDAKPELEIYADEVIASHGATVGQLDDKALFYMQSRGINRNAARRILTMAFCRSVADQVASPSLSETLGERLVGALEGGLGND
jgi:Fe-S cluster assembly protein SufD